MTVSPEELWVDVNGTRLGVLRWPGDETAPQAVAVHGLTANAWSWGPVARYLAGRVTLIAVDVRGRGRSAQAPGDFGIRSHADDVAEVIKAMSGRPCVVAGHSMGAYVALACRERHAKLVTGLVLVDAPTPHSESDAGTDLAGTLAQRIGPALTRLDTVWPDREAYRAMWAEHPSFVGRLTPEVEKYVLSDLVEFEGGYRSIVNKEAVLRDYQDIVTDDEIKSMIDRKTSNTTIIRAERGLQAQPVPAIPTDFVEKHREFRWLTVDDSNHYDVLVGEAGAQTVAQAITDAAVS